MPVKKATAGTASARKRPARPGPIALCTYVPRPGQGKALEKLVKQHYRLMRKLGMAAATPSTVWRARGKKGQVYFVELFHWASDEAVAHAHEHPGVARVWEPLGKLCADMSFPHVERLV
jgi:hypothetical protein